MFQSVDERRHYDVVYSQFRIERSACPVSCHVLGKARRKVEGVMHAFGIPSLRGARVLDVGCGLGYFAEALREKGGKVTAVDTSPVAIAIVNELFPKIDARTASFPEDFTGNNQFDVIWSCDFPLLNTFDVDFICQEFIRNCMKMVTPRGALIIGWHSNFSGTMGTGNFAHWPLDMIESLTERAGLSGPRVVAIPTAFLSNAAINLGRFSKTSIPIYFCRWMAARAHKRR